MRQRYSAQQWKDWIAEQAQSGLTVTEFCSRKQVSQGVFYAWRRKFADEPAAHHFVPVAIAGTTFVEIQFPAGVTIQVPNDAASLKPVLRVLLEIGADQ